jgi:hypothetical protein
VAKAHLPRTEIRFEGASTYSASFPVHPAATTTTTTTLRQRAPGPPLESETTNRRDYRVGAAAQRTVGETQ